MKGANTIKGQKGVQKVGNITQPVIQPDSEGSEAEENGVKMLVEKTQASDIFQELTSVAKDLLEFKHEMQKTFKDFQADLRKDVREESTTIKQE